MRLTSCMRVLRMSWRWTTRSFASALRPSDSYRTVHIECSKCSTLLFKYKKKNGTKSKLVKMYLARIVFDPFHFLPSSVPDRASSSRGPYTDTKHFHLGASLKTDHIYESVSQEDVTSLVAAPGEKELRCPQCQSEWGRPGARAGLDVFKCIGGKIRMS